jgi:hypothetical protein
MLRHGCIGKGCCSAICLPLHSCLNTLLRTPTRTLLRRALRWGLSSVQGLQVILWHPCVALPAKVLLQLSQHLQQVVF